MGSVPSVTPWGSWPGATCMAWAARGLAPRGFRLWARLRSTRGYAIALPPCHMGPVDRPPPPRIGWSHHRWGRPAGRVRHVGFPHPAVPPPTSRNTKSRLRCGSRCRLPPRPPGSRCTRAWTPSTRFIANPSTAHMAARRRRLRRRASSLFVARRRRLRRRPCSLSVAPRFAPGEIVDLTAADTFAPMGQPRGCLTPSAHASILEVAGLALVAADGSSEECLLAALAAGPYTSPARGSQPTHGWRRSQRRARPEGAPRRRHLRRRMRPRRARRPGVQVCR